MLLHVFYHLTPGLIQNKIGLPCLFFVHFAKCMKLPLLQRREQKKAFWNQMQLNWKERRVDNRKGREETLTHGKKIASNMNDCADTLSAQTLTSVYVCIPFAVKYDC